MGVRHHNVPAGLRAFGLSHIVSRVENAEAITEHYESIREEDRMSAGLGQLSFCELKRSCATICLLRRPASSTLAARRAFMLSGSSQTGTRYTLST